MTADDEATLATADRLEAAMTDLTTQFEVANARIQRNKMLIRVLAALIALKAVTIVCLVVLFARSERNWDAARQAQVTAKATAKASAAADVKICDAANESRAAQRELWAYILEETVAQPRADGTARQVGQIRSYVNKNFHALDCTDIARPAATAKTGLGGVVR